MTMIEATWMCLECPDKEDVCEIIVRVGVAKDDPTTRIETPRECPYGFKGCEWRRVQ